MQNSKCKIQTVLVVIGLMGASAISAVAQDGGAQGSGFPQTSTFTAQASAVALPGGKETVPASMVGASVKLSDKFSVFSANLLTPGGVNAYMGGAEYRLPALSKKLNNWSPVLDGNTFSFRIRGAAGLDVVNEPNGDSKQHWAFMATGAIDYDPTHSGKFAVQLVEAGWVKLPGYANSAPIIFSGVKLGFGK
jgi:hypothetical protein